MKEKVGELLRSSKLDSFSYKRRSDDWGTLDSQGGEQMAVQSSAPKAEEGEAMDTLPSDRGFSTRLACRERHGLQQKLSHDTNTRCGIDE